MTIKTNIETFQALITFLLDSKNVGTEASVLDPNEVIEYKASQHLSWVKHSTRMLNSYLLSWLCGWSTLAFTQKLFNTLFCCELAHFIAEASAWSFCAALRSYIYI